MRATTSAELAILRYYMGELREKLPEHPQHVIGDLSRRGFLTIHASSLGPVIITCLRGRAEVQAADREARPSTDPLTSRRSGAGER